MMVLARGGWRSCRGADCLWRAEGTVSLGKIQLPRAADKSARRACVYRRYRPRESQVSTCRCVDWEVMHEDALCAGALLA